MSRPTRSWPIAALLILSLFAIAGCGSSGGGGATWTVTASVAPAGGGTVTGDGAYDGGDIATLQAYAGTGYAFSQWTGDVPAGHETDNPVHVTVDGNLSLTAVFYQVVTLSVEVAPAEGGTTSGAGSYREGGTALLHASPATGYAFSQWTGVAAGDETDMPVSVTVDADKMVTAVFTPNAYTLNLVINIPGAGSVWGSGSRVYGSVVRIRAEANPGFAFSQFDFSSGAVPSTTDNPYDHTMSGDVTVTASFRPQATGWTWMAGPNSENQNSVYGTEEVSNPANQPGARQFAAGWTDASGNFWVNGGYGYAVSGGGTYYNDMWKFDAATGWWTWMAGPQAAGNYDNPTPVYGSKGTAAEANFPGNRRFDVSITAGSYLYLFGGYGRAADGIGDLNDLWRFDPSLGQWAWVSGAANNNQMGVYGTLGAPAGTNMPGSRAQAAGWSDPSGDLWVFGGYGWDDSGSGYKWMNDLWKYHPADGMWTWMGGASTGYHYGVYGTRGVADSGNAPGSRYDASGAATPDGLLWVFGGNGYDGSEGGGYLSDLWKFVPDTGGGTWTWVAGPKLSSQPAVYGTLGVPAAANNPGPRARAKLWADSHGALWLFGGEGLDVEGGFGALLDLWRFDVLTGKWAWMAGSQYTAGSASWGTLGVTDPSNTPGGRYNHTVAPIPGSTSLWLFGGTMSNWYSDLWRFGPPGN